jgi:SAM-dependent methyltransferase
MKLRREDLHHVFGLKYGEPPEGPNPRLWLRVCYYSPDDHYEAVVGQLVEKGSRWLDVGCGRDLFPSNPALARLLSARCGHLTGLDPDRNVQDNPWVHERVQGLLQDYHPPHRFNLVTLRMVAEHIADPETAVRSLARLTEPGGRVVIYTVHKWSPAAILARLVPFRMHHAIKRVLWGTEERDTFPVAYRMNTRAHLARFMEGAGFRESSFAYLPDCRLFGRFRVLHGLELGLWRVLNAAGLPYPENCLLGVYQRAGDGT